MADNREFVRCVACRLELPRSAFHRGRKKSGLTSRCKSCMKSYAAKWHQENRARKRLSRQAYMKEWRARQKEHLQQYAKDYSKRNAARRSAAFKAWYEKHKEEQRIKALDRRRRDLELHRVKGREWAKKNIEHRREYRKENRLRYRAAWQRRRARERAAEGRWVPSDIENLLNLQSNRCAYCLGNLGVNFQVDHIIPLSRGGSNWPSNLALACPSCNRRKSARVDMKPVLQVNHG